MTVAARTKTPLHGCDDDRRVYGSSLWLAWIGLVGYAGILQPAFLWLGRAVSSYVALLMLDTLWGAIDRRRPRKCDHLSMCDHTLCEMMEATMTSLICARADGIASLIYRL